MQAIYISSDQFKVSTDKTGEFLAGRRIRALCGSEYKYSTVQSSIYSSPYTTITIEESVLTSNLSGVHYGIVNIGEEGSLPNHNHGGSEGTGGSLTLLTLSDTPTTYSDSVGKYLKTTSSGIEFSDDGLYTSYNHTALVSPTFSDNENNHQFSTIQAAIDWVYNSSWYGDLDNEQNAAIVVYPGTYNEQLTSYPYVRVINAVDKDNQGDRKTVQVSPPADKKTEPLLVAGSGYVYNFTGITFTADPVEHGPYATAINARFYNCRFNGGSFLDSDAAYACGLLFVGSTFNAPTPINYTGARGHESRSIYIYDSYAYADMVLESTFATGNPYLEMLNCHFKATLSVKAAWEINVINSRIRNFTGSPNRITFDTTGNVNISDSILSGGIHFVSDPGDFSIQSCNFNEQNATTISGADITSDVPITNTNYFNNIQQNGIAGEIQTMCTTKAVGGQAINKYYSLQDAVDSITTTGVVDLQESFTDLPELTIASGTNITIEGHKIYSLTFTDDVVELGKDEQIVFYGLANLNGGNIEVNGDNAYIGFEETLTANAYVTLTSGASSYCLVYTSTIKAPTGHPAITVNNTDTTIVAGYSRIDGGDGHPAIWFSVEADNRLKAKFCTLLHGDGGAADYPIAGDGVYTVTTAIYMCAGNASLTPAGIGNSITGSGNVTDASINF